MSGLLLVHRGAKCGLKTGWLTCRDMPYLLAYGYLPSVSSSVMTRTCFRFEFRVCRVFLCPSRRHLQCILHAASESCPAARRIPRDSAFAVRLLPLCRSGASLLQKALHFHVTTTASGWWKNYTPHNDLQYQAIFPKRFVFACGDPMGKLSHLIEASLACLALVCFAGNAC